MADKTAFFDSGHPAAPSLRITRPDQLTPLILDLSNPAERLVGDYELLQMIGQGGMGIVYRARQRSLDRTVAVKLLAGSNQSPEFVARFQSEAQRAARMQHPNIVTIHEIGATPRFSFFSMQLVDGESMAERLARDGALPPREAALAMRTLAEAVEYAHELNILHLDLKPANVLVEKGGRLYIADFGLARPLDQALASEVDEISGTPSYMAPEQIQIREHRLSRATDIYGLGAMLYEFLSGSPPFRGANAQETLRRVLNDAPSSLRAKVPGLSRDLEAICMKCLAKAPAERYGSARELALDLGRFLDGNPISVRRPSLWERFQRWRRRHAMHPLAATALLVLLVGGGSAFLYQRELNRRQLEQHDEVSGLATTAMTSSLPTAQARAREFLGKALEKFEIDRTDGLAGVDAARDSLLSANDPALAKDAKLVVAYAHTDLLWADALERRGTPAALLGSTMFSKANEPLESEGERVFSAIRRAVAAAPDDFTVLSVAAQWCAGFTSDPRCPYAQIRARLRALQPDNAFVWAVSAPLAWKGPQLRARLGDEADYWRARELTYANPEGDWHRRLVAELDAVAPQVLRQAGTDGVDPRALVNFVAISETTLGVMSKSLANLNGLSDYCLDTLPDPRRDGLCAAFEQALAKGGHSMDEITYLAKWRAKRAKVDVDPERARALAWQSSKAQGLLRNYERFEPERSYIHDLESDGVEVARQKVLARHGVPLQPPADWKPKH